MTTLHLIGDIHGQYDKLHDLLLAAKLINNGSSWIGGDAKLCFLGDYMDRGPDGIDCIDLIMALQEDAPNAGGEVLALLGNHDVMILAAHLLGGDFHAKWERVGGMRQDMRRLNRVHVEWLRRRPAMVLLDEVLICHADSLLYYDYGVTIEQVNEEIEALLYSKDPDEWDWLLDQFADRFAFWDAEDDVLGVAAAKSFLDSFGGSQIVHGHTPISKMIDAPPRMINRALIYDQDRCVNVDAGMYLGAPGFVHSITLAERQ
ncbi:MAG: metallophosphoesterase family protein [Anaerolineae bacterium]|nr:serine/threonine protein phosphatase [Anaerolineae bacterium]